MVPRHSPGQRCTAGQLVHLEIRERVSTASLPRARRINIPGASNVLINLGWPSKIPHSGDGFLGGTIMRSRFGLIVVLLVALASSLAWWAPRGESSAVARADEGGQKIRTA